MHRTLKNNVIALVVGTAFVAAGPAVLAEEMLNQQGYITGSLVIGWDSRLPRNRENDAAKPGVADVFDMDVAVGNTFYRGKIHCLPYVFSRHVGRVLQEGSCRYDLDVGVINPADRSQQRVVGKMVGTATKDRSGRVDLTASNLRIEVQTIGRATGFTSKFEGSILSAPVKARTTLTELMASASKQTATLTRMAGGTEVSVTLGDVDPVAFQGVTLAAGPSANYVEAVMDGQFIFSYETDNWFPSLTVTHLGTKDRFTGGLKWVELSDDSGRYELNVFVNEDQVSGDESAAFEDGLGEEAFFMPSPSRATINGTIAFQDSFVSGVEEPVRSEVVYDLGLQGVTAQQAQIFWKALLLIPNQFYGE